MASSMLWPNACSFRSGATALETNARRHQQCRDISKSANLLLVDANKSRHYAKQHAVGRSFSLHCWIGVKYATRAMLSYLFLRQVKTSFCQDSYDVEAAFYQKASVALVNWKCVCAKPEAIPRVTKRSESDFFCSGTCSSGTRLHNPASNRRDMRNG